MAALLACRGMNALRNQQGMNLMLVLVRVDAEQHAGPRRDIEAHGRQIGRQARRVHMGIFGRYQGYRIADVTIVDPGLPGKKN